MTNKLWVEPEVWKQMGRAERDALAAEREAAWKRRVEAANAADVRQLAAQYVPLKRQGPNEWAGPCPMCGGRDRFHVKEHGWFCRNCRPIDQRGWGSAIDFVMQVDGLDFRGAVERLDTTVQMIYGERGEFAGVRNLAAAAAERQVRREDETPTLPSSAWRAEHTSFVVAAKNALIGKPNRGAVYLRQRGLAQETWAAFGMGYGETWDGLEAVVLPWYRNGILNAVRYRYLVPTVDAHGSTKKINAEHGSCFRNHLYGLPGFFWNKAGGKNRTLVLVEGELNAASIWQVKHNEEWDVLSTGSESVILTEEMIDLFSRYGSVVVWFDKAEIAKRWADTLDNAVAISSPLDGDKKTDANDMLRTGTLAAFLAAAR